MSEATLRKLLAEAEAEIPHLRTDDECQAHLLQFFAANAKDVAESTYLSASGLSHCALESAHDSSITKLLTIVVETLTEYGVAGGALLEEAIKATGDSFHARFMELAALNRGCA